MMIGSVMYHDVICCYRHCVFEEFSDHRDLHVLTHSLPTRRSSELRAGREIVVLDVREDWEVALCARADSLEIPMQQIPARKAELPQDKPLEIGRAHV